VNREIVPLDEEMAELSLLLPRVHALALIDAAQQEGVSVGQFMRQLVKRALETSTWAEPFSIN
jgi:hypothetical protein